MLKILQYHVYPSKINLNEQYIFDYNVSQQTYKLKHQYEPILTRYVILASDITVWHFITQLTYYVKEEIERYLIVFIIQLNQDPFVSLFL